MDEAMTYASGLVSDCIFGGHISRPWSYDDQNMGSNKDGDDRQRKDEDDDCQNQDRGFEMCSCRRRLRMMALDFIVTLCVIVIGQETGALGKASHVKRAEKRREKDGI